MYTLFHVSKRQIITCSLLNLTLIVLNINWTTFAILLNVYAIFVRLQQVFPYRYKQFLPVTHCLVLLYLNNNDIEKRILQMICNKSVASIYVH